MTTASELRAQAAATLAKAEELEKAEKLAKIASITQAIKDAGLTMADFGLTEHVATKKTRKPRQASAVKYRTPEGQEWTGVGRKPAWAKDLTAEQLAAFEVGATKPVEIDFSQLVAKQVTDDFGDAVLSKPL